MSSLPEILRHVSVSTGAHQSPIPPELILVLADTLDIKAILAWWTSANHDLGGRPPCAVWVSGDTAKVYALAGTLAAGGLR